MKFFRQFLRIDILVAMFVLLLTGSASAYIYQSLLDEREQKTLNIGGLQLGEKRLALMSKGKCVGTLSVHLEVTREVSALTLKGKIQVQAGEWRAVPLIEGSLNFNNLGQLGTSLFSIKSDTAKFSIGTHGLQKMRAVFRSTIGSESNKAEFPIRAGPFILSRTANGQYQISGPLPASWESLGKKAPLLSQLKDFNFKLLQIYGPGEACSVEKMESVDLTSIMLQLKALLQI